MLRLKSTALFISLAGLSLACAPKISPQSSEPQQEAAAQQDTTTYFITQQGDTLEKLDQPVQVEINRLLPDTVSIIGVGDIMLGTNFPDESYLPSDSAKQLLAGVAPVLQDAHLTFGNLEGVLLNEGGEQKKCNDPKLCYLFRMPLYMAERLKEAGFDALSLANNHAGDFGDTGRQSTMQTLDSLGIEHAGQLQQPYTLFKHEGLKWAMVAFSPNTGTLSITDIDRAEEIVQELDSLADIVLVSFHGGAEGKKHQHVTRETEEFYGENRGNVYEFSHRLIDAGADVIFGHGPHVTRAIEVYKDRFIAYSLGNFATYARFNLRGPNGITPIVKVFTEPDGRFIKADIIPVIQLYEGIPAIDPQKRAIKTIQELTTADFPEVPVIITDEGTIYQDANN